MSWLLLTPVELDCHVCIMHTSLFHALFLFETYPTVYIIGFLLIYNFDFILDVWRLADYITLGLCSVE